MNLPRRVVALVRLLALSLVAFVGSTSVVVRAADVWKPIEPALLAMTVPVVDKDADAEAIFWEVRVAYERTPTDVETILDHYIRVKVFNDRGRESQSKIDLYATEIQGRKFLVTNVSGRTVKPDGTIVEVKKDDIYDQVVAKSNGLRVNAKSFALPGVVPGAIVEYRWREIRNGIADYEQFDLSRDIPVQLVRYFVRPYQDTLLDSKGKPVDMRAETFHGKTTPFIKDKDGYYGTSMTNVPAFHYEPLMPPENAVRPWLLVYYAATVSSNPDQFWRDYGRSMASQMKSGLKVNSDIQKASVEIVGNAQSPDDKLQKLFDFVRSRIKRYNDDALHLTPEQIKKLKDNASPADTLKHGIGDGKDINLLFGALAAAAGFDVRVAFSSDRSESFFNRSFANNYSVQASSVAVKIGGQWRLFEPGNTYVTFGMLRWQSEGQETLIADEKEPVWITSPYSEPSKSLEKRTGKFKLTEDGTLEGDIRIEYTGHFAEDVKELNDGYTPAQREQRLKNLFRGYELTNISIENVTDPDKPFVYSFHARLRGYAQRTGRRLLIKPAVFQRGATPRFPTSVRVQMVYFPYPWTENDHIEIEIPAGYVLDSPEGPQSVNGGILAQYEPKAAITSDGRTLVYERKIYFGKDSRMLLFPVADYPTLKAFFDSVYKQDDQAIALRQGAPGN